VSRTRWVAITVALAATLLTQAVGAQQDPPHDTLPATADSATPLALRPTRSLELAREPQHAGWGWKVMAVVVILGGAAFYIRKRVPKRPTDQGLTIVRRTQIGIRSELLIVNVEGQRLLIGVTPNSIQSLAVLDGEELAAPSDLPDQEPSALGDRFAAMLKAAEPRDVPRAADVTRRQESGSTGARSAPEVARPDLPEAAREAALAGQARGLVGLRRRG
jgi:flagellar biogenesis protein FliO